MSSSMRSVCIVPLSAYRVPANFMSRRVRRRCISISVTVSSGSSSPGSQENGASCIVESSTKSSSGSTTGLFPRAISSRRREYPASPLFLVVGPGLSAGG
ncbi:unnamed protein product [Microthlaspi erraticum]|uniref:Uncharacterized protein n=1 Tax=Microthlaspi erraticum TaxID=1685480 RepID=A0A6D2HWF2_9BRAS|nr:unnamed protein product [Microthlaspi erraticum]